jgi:hypothetical protein
VAWILATHPSAEVRDGAEAVRLAEEACRITGYQVPDLLQSLAAAKAEAGDFSAAASLTERAAELAFQMGQTEQAEALQEQFRLYRDRRPLRQQPSESRR